jgi:adenylate cyclase
VYKELGIYDSATLNFLEASKNASEACDPFDLYYLYNSWGMLEENMERYLRSDSLYDIAYAASLQLSDKEPELNVLINQSNVLSNQQKNREAIQRTMQILSIAQEIESKYHIELSLGNLGSYYLNWGKYDSAYYYLFLLKDIIDSTSNPRIAIDMYNNLGATYLEEQKYDLALVNFELAIELARESNYLNNIDIYLKNLANLYYQLGNKDKAWTYLNNYIQVKNSLLDEEKMQRINEIQSKYDREIQQEKFEAEKKLDRLTRNAIVGGLLIIIIAIYSRLNYIRRSKKIVERAKKRSDDLLRNILPDEVAEELKSKGYSDARSYEEVTVLFTDFKDFTNLSEKLSATDLVEEINYFFKHFDEIVLKHGIEKIKTIGDSFMAAGGVPTTKPGDVKATLNAALDMVNVVSERNAANKKRGKPAFEMRVGINTGPVVAGIVGIKKFQYDIWGDTVNTASRIENACEPGKVNISESTYELVKDDPDYTFEDRGNVNVKGKGDLRMYFVKRSPQSPS